MADYQDIRGLRVKYLSADPSVTVAGEVWYNSTTGTLRSRLVTGAWSSTSPITTTRGAIGGTGVTQNAVVIAGGLNPPSTPHSATEEYNGSGWSNGGSLNTSRRDATLFGTQTSAIAAGGGIPTFTNSSESYDGSTWTAKPNINNTRSLMGSAGASNTSGLIFGGFNPPITTATEEWNGSTWTTVNVLNTARHNVEGVGIESAALAFGGSDPTQSTATETYDGTNWTTVNSMPTGVGELSGAGTQASAIGAGGYTTGYSAGSYTWDGTNWSNAPSLATARGGLGGGGSSSSSAVAAAGYTGTVFTAVAEEYNVSANTITAGTWAAGATYPTNSSSLGGCGTKTVGLTVGGYPPGSPPTGKSFEYNGIAWVNEATLSPNTGTQGGSGAVFGTQTAAVACMYNTPAPPYVYKATCKYDGTSWANGNDRPADNYSQAVAGISTAGLNFGGTPGFTNVTLEYDGTNWSIVPGILGTGRSEMGGSGTQTAALGAGGYSTPPATTYDLTEEYDGTNWTTSGAMITATRGWKLSGTQTDSLGMAGGTATAPGGTTACSRYDGTSWATSPSMATGRLLFGNSSGAVGEAFGAAGYYPGTTPNRTTTTEVFSVETSAANIETLTTS